MEKPSNRLPLLPLSDLVHFPQTTVKLRVAEPETFPLVRQLMNTDAAERWLGIVLLKPEWDRGETEPPEVYRSGTAARVLSVEATEGGYELLLEGTVRFEVELEMADGPCREAIVRLLEEPRLQEEDPAIQLLRRQLLGCAEALRLYRVAAGVEAPEGSDAAESDSVAEAVATQDAEPADGEPDSSPVTEAQTFEQLVNRLAAQSRLSPMRKQQLLDRPLPRRALELLAVLRSQLQILEILAPYRHLERRAEQN